MQPQNIAGFGVSIAGQAQVLFAINNFVTLFEDLRPVWHLFRDAFWVEERNLFATEGTSGRHGAWKELSKPYREWKEKRYPGAKILELSGALRDSLVGPNDGFIYEPSPRQLVIGTAVSSEDGYGYPLGHYLGEGNLPVRMAIDISEAGEVAFAKSVGTLAHTLGLMWAGKSIGLGG